MTSRKYAVYYLDPKTGTVNVTRGYYAEAGKFRFALIPNNKKKTTTAIDLWSGYTIFTWPASIKDTAGEVERRLDRLRQIYEADERKYAGVLGGFNKLISSSVPENADLPEGVYEYINGMRPFSIWEGEQ